MGWMVATIKRKRKQAFLRDLSQEEKENIAGLDFKTDP